MMHDIEEFIGWQPKPKKPTPIDKKLRLVTPPWETSPVDLPGDYEAVLGLMEALASLGDTPTLPRSRKPRPR